MTFRLYVRMGTLKNRISKMMRSLRFWVRATARKKPTRSARELQRTLSSHCKIVQGT